MKNLSFRTAILVSFLLSFCSSALAEKLDLRDKPFAERVANKLNKLAIGNNGSCGFEELYFDSDTQVIYGKVKFRVAHNWGTIKYRDYFSIPPVNVEKEIGVSAQAIGDFFYNLQTNSVGAGFELPLGERSVKVLGQKYSWNFGKIKLSADQIRRAMNGELVALADSIPTFGLISRKGSNDYQKRRSEVEQKYGGSQNVYFARKDPFVDSVRPTKGLEYAASLVATQGASSTEIMRQVTELAVGELQLVGDWLAERGVSDAYSVANTILRGDAVQVPDYYLAVNWIPVEYRSRIYVANGSQQVGPVIRETHGAFYIVLRKKQFGDQKKVDSDGFDRGPISGIAKTSKRIPNQSEELLAGFGFPMSQPARDPQDRYDIDIFNLSTRPVHVIVTRGHPTHGAAHPVIQPRQKHTTVAGGASERIVGVWDRETGQLLAFRSIFIDRNMEIIFHKRSGANEFSLVFAETNSGIDFDSTPEQIK